MNFKKKMRRGSLAALIALALTSSALAMPTGGEVVGGNPDITLSGGTWDAVANNATITANNDGQINWQTFNIGTGEILNFNIADDKTLVNQVTGAQLSSILGTMNQTGTGKGNVVLINPNGIYVGTNAVLNISDLTLSALSAEKATDTERILKAGGEGLVNVTGGHFIANEVNLIGRKVTVADGVVFDLGTSGDTSTKTMLQVLAADRAEWTFDGDKMLTENITHNAGNDVVFNGTVNMKGGDKNLVEIGGATASATNAKFHDERTSGDRLETTIYAASKVQSDERGADRSKHRFTAETTAANTVTADNILADGESFSLGGGVATLKNSSVSVDDLAIDGVASSSTRGDGKRMETLTAPDRTVTISNSNLTANEVGIYGGKVTIANDVTFRPLSPNQRDFEIVAGNVYHEQGRYTSVAGNELQFHGNLNGFGTTDDTSIVLFGNKVNLDSARFGDPMDPLHSSVGGLKIGAANEVNAKERHKFAATSTAANTLSANGAYIKSPASIQLLGGTVTFTNTNMDVAGEISVTTGALRELGDEARTITTAADQQITFDGTGTYKAKSIDVRGGKVLVDSGITFEAKNPATETGLDIAAGNESDNGAGAITYTMGRGNDVVFKGRSVNFGRQESEPVAILGSKVNLDGARIEGAGYVNAAAAQRIVSTEGTSGGARVTASAGNALSADGAQINAAKDIYLVGGNVALKSGTIQAGENVNLVAVRDFTTKGNSAAAGKDHVIYLDGAKIKGKDVTTLSGKVQMVNAAEIEGTNDASLYIGNTFTKTADDKVTTYATKENTLDMRASKVTAPEVGLSAGGAGIFDHSIVAGTTKLKDTELHVPSGSDYVGKIDGTSRVTSGGLDEAGFERITDPAAVPPTPEQPVPPAVPDTIAPAETPLSVQDKENIETGKTKAMDALVEPTQEKRVEALTKTVTQLNEKVGTSRRQTAGVVVGIVQEIANAATLSDGEKVALVESVLNAYTPVQEAKAGQENLSTNTVNEAVHATETVSVAPVYPDETEAEETVSFT
mgnify:CR=1 FL=1